MSSLSNRQSILRPTSTRTAAAHLGLAQQPTPRPVSGRFMAAHLGVGRSRTVSVDILRRRLPAPVSPDIAQFYQLRAAAQRLQQQLAAHDARTKGLTPKQAGYPFPFRSTADQQRARAAVRDRQRLAQRLLAEVNQSMKAFYAPAFSSAVARSTPKKQVTLPNGGTAWAEGTELFMPNTFWHSQYRDTPPSWKSHYVPAKGKRKGYWTKFNHWRDCCDECQKLIKKALGNTPNNLIQVVEELDGINQLNQSGALQGYHKLDEYMALHKPVMIGVSFALGQKYNNDKTTEHFVVLVGAGVEKGRKYYRFFDVGTLHQDKGTNPNFKLYYNPQTGFCQGPGILGTYTLTQIRY
ncbi:hypothetical protein [Hymenobacter terrenus]|uniref:hypothetical protein n=1 Tax=Hymenobacter terrenus TaxID=1629124 RepID=UPI000619C40F|nr:hypothetical protein [Hymenobacter terrenus]